eukprot:CAMPEP_0173392140 /NCGR_PEP_ID=MMETSP1356-20130122/18782_1 /TAXON_ID=77927 ORGANISM="Hemiselmis virescens, Strain PCC157" /NCGR_SAMPLE_ID=MMETSP1356 /ASSEMBLY_ACC=CAM_ASM_000847 /LENGTH=336 /DNA_ID=CAMNT_0014349867 /DNA_START=51 /DNA_END=1061 /DNA_ORIENTATION=-
MTHPHKLGMAVLCLAALPLLCTAFHLPSLPARLSTATSPSAACAFAPRLRQVGRSSSLLTQPASRANTMPALRMAESSAEMKVQDGDVVGVTYKGTMDDGEVFDENTGQALLEFEVGSGRVIKGFDKAVRGLAIGESREVRCEPDEAYGPYDDDNVAVVPRENMPDPPENMKLEEGMVMQLATGQIAVIKEVTDDQVTLDGNHPLAGKTLNFKVTVGSIMDRTKAVAAKVSEMETILSNPLLGMVAADVLGDKGFIDKIKKGLDDADDKGKYINGVLGSPEWVTINEALMKNPELLKLVRDPEALERMAQGMPETKGGAEEAADSKVVEADFEKDA